VEDRRGVAIYEVNGPFFFGAADKLEDVLGAGAARATRSSSPTGHAHWMRRSFMPIQGKKESKQRAIKSPQTSGNTTARGALGALVTPSPDLAHIVGSQPLTRGDAMKRVWDYIKKHDLQDPKNKRRIIADDNLRPVFDGNESLTMFEMTAYISRHLNKG
jgi:chromatin remodeling complex protein RSC6